MNTFLTILAWTLLIGGSIGMTVWGVADGSFREIIREARRFKRKEYTAEEREEIGL